MLRHRIQCIRPPNVGRGYFPGACEVLRGVPRDQDVGANDTRSSRRQASTSCELKAMHLVHAHRLRCADVDHGSLHVDKVKFGAYADSTDYAVKRRDAQCQIEGHPQRQSDWQATAGVRPCTGYAIAAGGPFNGRNCPPDATGGGNRGASAAIAVCVMRQAKLGW
jgi:hypothetical protein